MGLNIQMAIRKNRLFIRLVGELDQAVTENLKIRVSEVIDKYMIKHVIINFEKLSFMDSSGIGFIIGRYNYLKKVNGSVILCSMNDQIRRLVMLSGLARICQLRKNEEEVNKILGVA